MQSKKEIKQKLTMMANVLYSYHVSRVGLFGSFVHDTQDDESDIDLLVDFKEPIDLFAYVNLIDMLSNSMKHKVDIITINGIKPALKDRILSEVEWIEGI
jgi:predicted nucleotidyltransferase